MAKTGFKNVPDYIASHPPAVQRALKRVRSAIRKGMPKAEEVISYQIPAYKVDGRAVLYFAGWKAHYSLYPSTRRLVAAFKKGQHQGLVDALKKMKPVGRIAITGTLGYDLNYIALIPSPTGRRWR